MRILWVSPGFLHPTTRGGQIRTLALLKQLHRRHEIHYAALADPDREEGPARSAEYCHRAYSTPFRAPATRTPAFLLQLARGLVSPLPVVIFRWRSARMRALLAQLLSASRFDVVVCDFLTSAVNLPRLEECVLFQHNLETLLWERLAASAGDPVRRAYFQLQAGRMFRYERQVCRRARHVMAVSEADAGRMRDRFGLARVSVVPTGVDVEFFQPPPEPPAPGADLVFVGSMDYLPNVDAVEYFAREILPLIRRRRPQCRFTVVGRKPRPSVLALARRDPLIQVTGTVPDVRPYLWSSAAVVVPLRSGGGTRLKIYEAMAARTAVVSTRLGAEGLAVQPPVDIRIADTAEDFAAECLRLLENPGERRAVAEAGWRLVSGRFSWEQASRELEAILERQRGGKEIA